MYTIKVYRIIGNNNQYHAVVQIVIIQIMKHTINEKV